MFSLFTCYPFSEADKYSKQVVGSSNKLDIWYCLWNRTCVGLMIMIHILFWLYVQTSDNVRFVGISITTWQFSRGLPYDLQWSTVLEPAVIDSPESGNRRHSIRTCIIIKFACICLSFLFKMRVNTSPVWKKLHLCPTLNYEIFDAAVVDGSPFPSATYFRECNIFLFIITCFIFIIVYISFQTIRKCFFCKKIRYFSEC